MSRPASDRPSSAMPELIYVIEGAGGLVKIGVSGDPLARLAQLQTASHVPLQIAYSAAVRSGNAFPLEQTVHAALGRYRQSGEWFNVPPQVAVAAIAAASHQIGDPIVEIAKEHLRYAVDRARAEERPAAPKRTTAVQTIAWIFFGLFLIGMVSLVIAIAYIAGQAGN